MISSLKTALRNGWLYLLISALMVAGVYKIDQRDNAANHRQIVQIQRLQAQQAANGAKITQACHGDLVHINAAHAAIREQANIQIGIARQSITAIDQALAGKFGNAIPGSLRPVYKKALVRDHKLIRQEIALRDSVVNVQFIC